MTDIDRPAMTSALAQAIASAITRSSHVVLVQRGIPDVSGQLSSALGNNSAQHVILLLEMFLADGTTPKER